jgi:hypothetical protein
MEYGSRTRVTNNDSPPVDGTTPYVQWFSGVSYDEEISWTYPGLENNGYMIDVVDEHFPKRVAQGEIFNNAMHSMKVIDDNGPPTPFHREMTSRGSDGTLSGSIFSGAVRPMGAYLPEFLPLPSNEYLDSLRDKAVTQAYGNRSMVVQAVSMTVMEGKKTIQGVYEILFRVAEIALAAKRLDFRYLRSELSPSELKDRYMELRYAIRPLVIDATNIVKAYDANMGKLRKTARGGDQDRDVVSDSSDVEIGFELHRYTRTSVYDISTRAGVLCDVDCTKLNVWGADQLFETIYEGIPWSFIVNWFVDFASLIAAWSPKIGVRELASWVSSTITSTQQVTCSQSFIPGTQPQFDEGYSLSWTGSRTRIVVEKERIPQPKRSVWPSLDIQLDSLKLIDLAIILQGIVSGKVTKFMK